MKEHFPIIIFLGKPLNLTCSSLGGSPPPQIKWYREGQSQLLESTMIIGANRDEASKSVLTILPHKNTDGAVYRCTVWNRALGQHQKLETRTQLAVNCKLLHVALLLAQQHALFCQL